ncbi:MAG: OsmC family protein [Chloroflexi bacterium]|nr:OsmC family protein [Chloroflexota bacterium]
MAVSYKTWVKRTGKRKGYLTCGNGPEMEFGAPAGAHGRHGWMTPEDAFVAAVNTCIHMMFLWVADRMKIDLVSYECEAEGFVKRYLDKTEEFTHVVLRPKITVRNDDGSKVRRALEITKKYSLIAASIKSRLDIEPEIVIDKTA